MCISNSLVRVQTRQQADSDDLELLFHQAHPKRTAAIIATQTTNILHWGVARFANVVLALPPIAEQRLIVRHLKTVTLGIDAASERACRAIDLLHEFLVSLIKRKVDVRDVASALSEEMEAVEPVAEELIDEDKTTDDAEFDTGPKEIEA